MLWVTLYSSGVKDSFPDGTYLDLKVTEPCEFRILIQNPSYRGVQVGVDADPAIVKAVRSNARTKR